MPALVSGTACDTFLLSSASVGRHGPQASRVQLAYSRRKPLQKGVPFIKAYVADQRPVLSANKEGVTHNLQEISEPNFNIAHIRRDAPAGTDLLSVLHGQPSIRAVARCKSSSDSVNEAVCKLLSQFPTALQTELLSSDMQQVILDFLNASGFEAVDVALSIITQTSCPRFHADHVELRCLCTYAGEGTFFVPNQAVDRRMWMRALGIQDTKGFGIKKESAVQQASEWDLLVLKGNAFPGNEGAGAVHKSPIASEESPRLLLTLDKAREHCCSEY